MIVIFDILQINPKYTIIYILFILIRHLIYHISYKKNKCYIK